MKWVHIGLVQAVLFVGVAAWIDRAHRNEIIAGGTTAAVLMYAQYLHAKDAGMRSSKPGTEDTNNTAMASWDNVT